VNGDGYADVIVGVREYDNGQMNGGCVFVYYGNSGDGLDLLPRQLRTDGSTPIAPLGMSDPHTGVRLGLIGRNPAGREKVKLQWQVAPLGMSFAAGDVISGTGAEWSDTGTTGVDIAENVTGLTSSTPYHWRARLLYRPGNPLGQAASRWVHIPWNGWTEIDFRTTDGPITGLAASNDSPTPLGYATTLTVTADQVYVAYTWAFGDGDNGSGARATYVYPSTGIYTATVTASNSLGALTATTTVTITEPTAPNAAFTGLPLFGTIPLTVTFSDQSIGAITSWSWDFGDGGTSTDQDPTHTYTVPGIYTVTLTVDGPGGSDTETKSAYVTVVAYEPPNAAFTGAPRSGTAPLVVAFTDQSIGDITAWDWTFGDGNVSGARHPEHEYTAPGAYTVSLVVSGPGGSDAESKASYITIFPPDGIPTCEINYIYPNSITRHPTQMVYFNGNCYDNDPDEGGAYMVAHRWRSDIDGLLSAAEDFSIPASELSVGTHVISLQGQDDEGEWSPEAIHTLIVQAPPTGMRTLILVNRQKLETLYSASEADQVMDKVDLLAAHASVSGLVVQVEDDATVAVAYTLWDADPTNTAKANGVAEAIKTLVDAHWASHPGLEYLVIVGDDRAIPFRRVPDRTSHPESNYAFASCASVTGAALCDDMTLTDDYYASEMPIPLGGHELYIPGLGIGRLIETPGEIIAQIDAFLTDDGIAVSNAVVTGCGFVKDVARAVCNKLGGDGLTADCTLIGDSWTADQFKSNVLNTRHDVVAINGHARHYLIVLLRDLSFPVNWSPLPPITRGRSFTLSAVTLVSMFHLRILTSRSTLPKRWFSARPTTWRIPATVGGSALLSASRSN
jgi:PKD repeat protein